MNKKEALAKIEELKEFIAKADIEFNIGDKVITTCSEHATIIGLESKGDVHKYLSKATPGDINHKDCAVVMDDEGIWYWQPLDELTKVD